MSVEFCQEYFEDEVIDGFYVPSMCKRAWACELEILNWFHETCRKYDIKYTLDWGSLIGAVRHGGVIPWDDDVDLSMHRNEYNRLRAAAEKELPRGWSFLDFRNSDNWKFIVELTNTPRMNFDIDYMQAHHGFPYIATIDIYILDNITDDEEYEKKRVSTANSLFRVSDMIYFGADRQRVISELDVLKQNTGIDIKVEESLVEVRRNIFCQLERLFSEKNDTPTERVGQFVPWVLEHGLTYERKCYEDVMAVPFGNIEANISMAYEYMLTRKFGEYCRISYSGVAHGYPYYESQRKALGEDIEFTPRYDVAAGLSQFLHRGCGHARRDYREIVFIPYEPKYWHNCGWAELYRRVYEEAEKADYPVYIYVIPSPVYAKDVLGETVSYRFDISGYPEDVPLVDFREYDFAEHMPDEVYIQCPYDEFNMAATIHPSLYASNIRRYTEKLVYVPYFTTGDFDISSYPHRYNMRFYAKMPGVVLSDEVYLESSGLVDNYISCLCEDAGEEHREIWEGKFKTIGAVLGRDDGAKGEDKSESRKKFLYYISPSPFYSEPDRYMKKIRESVATVREFEDRIDMCVAVNSRLNNEIWEKTGRRELSQELCDILKDCSTIEAEEAQHEDLVRDFAAYYGLPSVFAKDFVLAHKPVMIQSIPKD